MHIITKYKWHSLAFIVLTVAYVTTRLYRLDSLPIFTDEAIYMWWAQTGKLDASWRFISLVDGKQPFYIWLSMVAMYPIKDPLLAGRYVSVIAGFFSVVGLVVLSKELFKNYWVGIIAGILYVIYPFAIVHDRMALYDTLVGTLFIWIFYIEILLVKRIHSTLAFILGLVMGAGFLTKSNVFMAAALLPTTLFLFDQPRGKRLKKFLLWLVYGVLAVGLAYVYYSILRLTPFFGIITTKNAEFVYPLGEWIQHPFTYFTHNATGILTVLIGYMTIPIMIVIGVAFFVQRNVWKEKLLLLIWFGAPLVYLAFFGKIIYPRHYFFATLFLLPLAGLALVTVFQRIKNKLVSFFLFLVIIALPLYADYLILTNFSKAPLPDADRFQYTNGWPSGGGVREAISLFQKESKDKKIHVFTQGTFGLMPYALNIYLQGNRNIDITGIWPIPEQVPADIMMKAKILPTYVLFYQECKHVLCKYIGDAPPHWPLKEVLKVRKSEDIYLSVYKVEVQ